jgi:hypothetical protein
VWAFRRIGVWADRGSAQRSAQAFEQEGDVVGAGQPGKPRFGRSLTLPALFALFSNRAGRARARYRSLIVAGQKSGVR